MKVKVRSRIAILGTTGCQPVSLSSLLRQSSKVSLVRYRAKASGSCRRQQAGSLCSPRKRSSVLRYRNLPPCGGLPPVRNSRQFASIHGRAYIRKSRMPSLRCDIRPSCVSPDSEPLVRWRSQERSPAEYGIDRPAGDLTRLVNVFGLFETWGITSGFESVQIRYDTVLPHHCAAIDKI